MGKGKYIKSKKPKRDYLRTYILIPYGILKLYRRRGHYEIESQDLCPRCGLLITSSAEVLRFHKDLKGLYTEIGHTIDVLKIKPEEEQAAPTLDDELPCIDTQIDVDINIDKQ